MLKQKFNHSRKSFLDNDSKFKFNWLDMADECMLLLDSNVATRLVSTLKKKYHTNEVIAKIIGNNMSIYRLKENTPIRVKTLKKILDCLNLSYTSYDKNVHYHSDKSVYTTRFPIVFDKVESAILIAAFMSDGNNQSEHPFYCNTDFLGDKILHAVQTFFPSIPHEIRDEKLRFHPLLSHLLLKLGVPIGDKILLNPKIPEIVYKKKEYKVAYLTQIFDDEGHAPTTASRKIVLGRSVSLNGLPKEFSSTLIYKKKLMFNSLPESIKYIVSKQPPNLLKGEYELLKEFGIKSSLRCRGITLYLDRISADWVVEIAGKKNISKFNKDIGFSHPDKVKKTKIYIGS